MEMAGVRLAYTLGGILQVRSPTGKGRRLNEQQNRGRGEGAGSPSFLTATV